MNVEHKEWRVEEGDIKGNYRVTVEGRVVAFMIDREIAEQIVRDHNFLLKALCLKISKLGNFGQVYAVIEDAVEDAKAVLNDRGETELARQEFRYEGCE